MSEDGGDGSPAPAPRRRLRKVMVLSSASDSDSDASSAIVSTRRKRPRVTGACPTGYANADGRLPDSVYDDGTLQVLSDDGSDSSGSSVMAAGRRRRTLPALRDSEADSDSSGSSSSWASEHAAAPVPAAARPSGFASDSSEGNSDKCSICLLRFKEQEVGTPETCEHIFCLDCITEWSKNVNTCPVDRIMFNTIIVRTCAGGRVLRTEPVKVVERRPSVEVLVVEDPTPCEICGSSENEETMLLCDGCDLGYHMQCLTPPLTEVPIDQWLCPNCDDLLDIIHTSELDDLFSGIVDLDLPHGPRPTPLREPRNVRRSGRNRSSADEPSTSSGRRGNSSSEVAPSTSRGSRTSRTRGGTTRTTTRRRTAGTQRRRQKRRRTRTVIIEYEVQENGKFPVTKTVKRKVKKRKKGLRVARTAARRSHVRASVRAQLQALGGPSPAEGAGLALRRHRAAIAPLSLFGDPYQLEYFSEEEVGSEGAVAAVASRPTSAVLAAFRQARRKIVSIPSPPRAAAAPDLLGSIMESQALLHSRAALSLEPDGRLRIEPAGGPPAGPGRVALGEQRAAARQAPAYPGQPRGGGGWGGGYRGGAGRDTPGTLSRTYDAYAPARAPPPHAAPAQRREPDGPGDGYSRRPPRYLDDDPPFERRRSDGPRPPHPGVGRPPWRPPPRHRLPYLPPHAPPPSQPPRGRHSFGGFDDPLDMRTGRPPRPYPPLGAPPPPPAAPLDLDRDRSEDERSDPDLVIDTDKYDPTEPTHDDDSADEEPPAPPPAALPPAEAPPPPVPALPAPPSPPPAVRSLLAGLEASALNVPATVLDSAVRQVLQEHRSLMAPAAPRDRSDDDSDGDCPNFSIYSATSVHIASDSSLAGDRPLLRSPPAPPTPPPPPSPPTPPSLPAEDEPPAPEPSDAAPLASRSREDEYKERVSRRCPITTNTRNPIKIKLNTPSLIRRQVSLYDEEDVAVDEAPACSPPAPEPPETEHRPVNGEPDDDAEKSATDDGTPESRAGPERRLSDTKSDERMSDEKAEERASDASVEERASPTCEIPRPASPRSAGAASPRSEDELEPEEEGEEEERHRDDATDEEVERAAPLTPADAPEKMTESISETEDERSYTPCLDENKSKDTSLETDKDKGIEGLDTEMISEEEGNDMFSDEERSRASRSRSPSRSRSRSRSPSRSPSRSVGRPRTRTVSPSVAAPAAPPPAEDGEILDRRVSGRPEDAKKKKKDSKKESKDSKKEGKDSKKEAKDKKKGEGKNKKDEIAFKKLSKSGKERNYRERERDKEKEERGRTRRERRESGDEAERKRRRKEKRKDLERYDVRTLVSEKRRRAKDAFGRDVSPRARSPSAASPPRSTTPSPRRRQPSPRSPRRRRDTPTPSPRRRATRSRSPRRRESPRRKRVRREPSPAPVAAKPAKRKKRARSAERRREPRRKSPKRKRPRRTSRASPPPAPRAWSPPSVDSRLLSPRTPPPGPSPAPPSLRAASPPPAVAPSPPPSPRRHRERRREERARHRRGKDTGGPSKEVFTSGDNILVSVSFKDQERDREVGERRRRKETKRDRRRKRKRAAAAADAETAKPVAIIDLDRSPFREITPSPKNVIVLSDSDHGEREAERPPPPAAAAEPAEGAFAVGPKTPPEPAAAEAGPPRASPERAAEPARGPATPPDSPDAYDPFEPTRSASASPRAEAAEPAPPTHITLETAQKTNMSADDVIDRRPISPIEKVMALLQSTRDVPPDPPPGDAPQPPCAEAAPAAAEPPAAPPTPAPPQAAAAPRIVLPSPTRAQPPKLFLAKPSPIKSNPVKPMQATKISRLPLPMPRRPPATASDAEADSPYSPGSSDFGDLFEPPGGAGGGAGRQGKRDTFDALFDKPPRARRGKSAAARVPVKLSRKKGNKTQVGVKIDEDNLKILDDLPSSAVEMQVKSKFLKKLNRQERVVEEVKLVLKPHYNKKHVTKEEYKDILRRAVPKICHNKSGEINPAKIQSLVEAYVKKFRKKHKLGLA